jgi:hypothetical protein
MRELPSSRRLVNAVPVMARLSRRARRATGLRFAVTSAVKATSIAVA